MVWCNFCGRDTKPYSYDDSFTCCSGCGKVFDSAIYSTEVTFTKNSAGQSRVSGSFVDSVQKELSASRERILYRARMDMDYMVSTLGIAGGDNIIECALALYTKAMEMNFTKGRRTEQVEAACLYVACRQNSKPFLLIDFSEYLKVNVYVLGAVFLQLCEKLSLREHPIVQRPVDPSLFIHRFMGGLPGGSNMEISRTALRIIASMKRDWMQTGRKPSGLCGAALYIASLSHGLKCSKLDIIKVVHVCEATLTKRLIEFENTESGSLTIEEFNTKAEELERLCTEHEVIGSRVSGICELLCIHKKDSGITPFAHGLCKDCHDDFIKLSGGLDGGSEPPAFQRAEMERMAKEASEENFENDSDIPSLSGSERVQLVERGSAGVKICTVNDNPDVDFHEADQMSDKNLDESERFSDIDDFEVEGYLHNEEEKQYKKIIWEEMNKEYLEEQAVKEAAAAAAAAAQEEEFKANFRGRPEELQAALELERSSRAAVAKSRKERREKNAAEARNSGPPQTAAEATHQMLSKKRHSSRINYDVLKNLFDENEADNHKRSRAELTAPENEVHEPEDVFGNDGQEDEAESEDDEYTREYGDYSYEEDGYDEDNY